MTGEKIYDQGEKGDVGEQGNKGKGGIIFIFILIYLLSAGVLAYGAYEYGLYRGGVELGEKGKVSLYDQVPSITVTQEPSGGVTEVPITDYRLQATATPKPTAVVKPSTIPTVTPTTSNLINYQYQLPSGWQVVQAVDASFEVGFEPKTTKPKLDTIGEIGVISTVNSVSGIDGVKVIGGSLVIQVKILSYSGTDKKSFVLNTAGVTLTDQNKTNNYKEVEFSIDGRSCYFLEGLNVPNYGAILGMCDAGGGKAFWVNTGEKEYISIVRSLKRLR